MRRRQQSIQQTCTNRLVAAKWCPTIRQVLLTAQAGLRYLICLPIAAVILVLLLPTPLLAQQASKLEDPQLPSGWNLSLDDSLSTNSGDWSVSDSCQFTQGIYQLSAEAGHWSFCLDNNADFSDFAFEAKVTGGRDTAEALYFHYDDNDSGYRFIIDQKGGYDLYVDQKGRDSEDIASGTSEAIHMGPHESNLIEVVVRGDAFDLYVNQQFISTVADGQNTFDHGMIGFEVIASDNKPGEASFSDVKVWAPVASKPSVTPTPR
jgi:hypothetical protein